MEIVRLLRMFFYISFFTFVLRRIKKRNSPRQLLIYSVCHSFSFVTEGEKSSPAYNFYERCRDRLITKRVFISLLACLMSQINGATACVIGNNVDGHLQAPYT